MTYTIVETEADRLVPVDSLWMRIRNLAFATEAHEIQLPYFLFVLPAELVGIASNAVVFYFYRYKAPASIFSYYAQVLSLFAAAGLIIVMCADVTILARTTSGDFDKACGIKVYAVLVMFVVYGLQLSAIAMERWRKIVHPAWTQFNIRVCRVITGAILLCSFVLNLPSYILFQVKDVVYAKSMGTGPFAYVRTWQCLPSSNEPERALLHVYVMLMSVVFGFTCLSCFFFHVSVLIHYHHTGSGPVHQARAVSKVTYSTAYIFGLLTIVFLMAHLLSFLASAVASTRQRERQLFTRLTDKMLVDVLSHLQLLAYSCQLPVFVGFSLKFRKDFANAIRALLCMTEKTLSTKDKRRQPFRGAEPKNEVQSSTLLDKSPSSDAQPKKSAMKLRGKEMAGHPAARGIEDTGKETPHAPESGTAKKHVSIADDAPPILVKDSDKVERRASIVNETKPKLQDSSAYKSNHSNVSDSIKEAEQGSSDQISSP